MEINIKAIPKKVLNSFTIKGENSDGSLNLISVRHPEIKTFQMSRVGKYIYDRCSGSNTVLDIIESIMNDFNNVTYEKVRQDLFNILFLYWRIGFIEWDQNPYDYFYNDHHKDYQFKILTEDETTVILAKIKEHVEPNYDLKYDKKYALNEKRIKQSIYFNNEQYSCILENNDLKCLICIKSEHIKKTSVDLIVLYLTNEFQDEDDTIYDFIKWSKERFSKILSRDIFRINCYLFENSQMEGVLKKLGFEKIGELKDSIILNEEIMSLIIKSLKFEPTTP